MPIQVKITTTSISSFYIALAKNLTLLCKEERFIGLTVLEIQGMVRVSQWLASGRQEAKKQGGAKLSLL